MNPETKIFFIIGVSGVGKSTIGILLSEALGISFFDGDDFHSESNILKMSNGHALDDTDRQGWLESINALAQKELDAKRSCVIACSALKKTYRDILHKNIERNVKWIFLDGSFKEIKKRLDKREGHYMGSKLLKTQFDILEEPKDAIRIDIKLTPDQIVREIKYRL